MTIKTLRELKTELLELKKETEHNIGILAHRYALTLTRVEFGDSDLSKEEAGGVAIKSIIHGNILNKIKKTIEEKIAEIEKVINYLESKEE